MRARTPLAVVLLILALAGLIALGPQAAAEELLFNGDFSQGEDGWRAFGDLVFDTGCDGHAADPAARLQSGGGSGRLVSDPIPIEPGGTYEASGYAHFLPGSDLQAQFDLALAFYEAPDGTGPDLSNLPPARLPAAAYSYMRISTGHVIAPGRAHSARLRIGLSMSGAAVACVDDLSLDGPPASPTETPSPTVPAPSSTPTPRPSPTVGPTATATEIPIPSESILNGGFEQGVEDMPAVWRKFGGFLSRSTSFARSGSFAGAFSSTTDSTKWVHQPLSIQPGHSYTFHGFVRKNGPPDSLVFLRISWYTSPDASGSSLASSDSPETLSGSDPSFRHLSTGSLTAPQEARSARARIVLVPASAAPETIYLDDFSLEETAPPTPTPEPTMTETPPSTPTPTPPPDAAGAASTVSDRLMNGGFEQGTDDMPAVWRKFGGFLSRSTSFARSGSFAGAFSSTTSATKWVYQPLSIEPGRSYAFHGFVRKNGPPDSLVFLRISWYTSPETSGSSFASSDSPETLAGSDPSFRYLSTGSLTAPQEARSARVRIVLVPASAAPETIYLDDFAFPETTPPVSSEAGQTASAQGTVMDDIEPASGPSDGGAPASSEVLRSSRRTSDAQSPEIGLRPPFEDSPYAVKISEVVADAGRGRDDAAHEWVELHNAGSEDVDLGGWSLTDNTAADTLPPAVLHPGTYAVVAASADFQLQYPGPQRNLLVLADGRIGSGLANGGDRLLLLDEEHRPVDALSYGSDHEFFQPPAPTVPAGHSLERFPPDRDTDTALDFRDNANPSPGWGPAALPSPTVTASPLSEVEDQALSPTTGGGPPGPWFLLVAGIILVGGTGAGVAGTFLWLTRGSRR